MSSRKSIRKLVTSALAYFLFLLSVSPALAVGITSIQSGDWFSSSTWDAGAIPTSVDSITVNAGHTVTIASLTVISSSTLVLGTLKASRVVASSWTLVSGDLTIGAGGFLDYGSEADPIPSAAFAHLILASGTVAGQYGLTVNNGGRFSVRGSTKTPYAFATQNITTSDTSLTVYGSTSTIGWQTGDVIAIGPTTGNGPTTTSSRTITSITGGPSFTVNWSGGVLSQARTLTSATPIIVANLTRNVLVRSSGTIVSGAGGNSAYIRNLASLTTDFALAQGEFAFLGANLASKSGITVDGSSARGWISSATVRNGYNGIALSGSSNNTLIDNSIISMAGTGITLSGSSSNTVSGNNSLLNASDGILLELASHYNALRANNSFSGSASGILLSASSNNTLDKNNLFSNSAQGVRLFNFSQDNLLAGNNSYSNLTQGILLENASHKNALSRNASYSNSSYGLHLMASSSTMLAGGALGYDSDGVSRPNTTAEIYFEPGGAAESLTLQGSRVNPSNGVSAAGFDVPGGFLLSYSQDYSTGVVRLWGHYQLSGSTMTLDHALELHASTNTAPKLMRGAGHSVTAVVTYTTITLSELITVTHAGGNSWSVKGSTSGFLGSVACAPSTSGCVFSTGKVDFNLNTGSVNGAGDSLDFITTTGSGDSNVQKKLLFGPAAPGYNNGRSKIEIASTGGIVLRGKTDGTANTLIDMFAAGSTYYTFVDSGAFTAVYSSFTNADPGGIQLSGTAGVSLATSTFDFLGFGLGTNAYITARDLAANATFYDVTFGLSRSSAGFPTAYNAHVEGSDAGLSLHWRRSLAYLGPMWGENSDQDPNNKILWDLVAEISTGSFQNVFPSSLTLSWSSNYPSGTYHVTQISTGAFPNGFAGNQSSTTLNFTATFTGLSGNTTYFAQVSTAATGLFISLNSTSTLAADPASLTFSTPTSDLIQLNWSGAGNGPGTIYSVLTSTAANPSAPAGAVVTTSVTFNTYMSSSGLQADTSYYFRVAATNNNGWTTAFTAAVGTQTALITASSFTISTSTGLTVSWNSTYVNGTAYIAQLSTGSFPNSFTGNQSSTTLNKSAGFASLSGNTTYYARVSTSAGGAFIGLASTSTLAADPASLTFSSTTSDAIQLNWSGAGNGPGTIYTVLTSTAADPGSPAGAVVTTSVTFNTYLSSTGLMANTTYSFRVAATNNNGLTTAFTAAVSTPTSLITAAGFTAVSSSSLTVLWNSTYLSGTSYIAHLSTGIFPNSFTGNLSSTTLNKSAGFSGLSANTTYFAQVSTAAAGLFISLNSTSTLAAVPASLIFSAPSSSTIQLNWSATGNSTGTIYTVLASTSANPAAPAGAVVTTSATLNVSLSSSGLAANASYFFMVAATNNNNLITTFTSVVGTVTLPSVPVAAAFSGVQGTSVTIQWSSGTNANGGALIHRAEISSGAFPNSFSGNVGSLTVAGSYSHVFGAGGVLPALSTNTLYYFQIQALNASGASAFISLGSTRTLPDTPGASGTPQGSALGVSSISWNWAAAPSAVSYRIYPASSPTAILASTPTLSYLRAGLSTNTAYGLVVAGINDKGEGPLSASATVYTLAAPPTGPYLFANGRTSATIIWSSNTNPAGTLAEVQRSTDGAGFGSVLNMDAVSHVDTSLSECSTYHYRVRYANGDGLATAFAPTVTFRTLGSSPTAPSELTAVSLTGQKVQLSWTASPTSSVVEYRLYSDMGTGSVDYNLPMVVLSSSVSSYITGVLASSAAYRFALRAKSACGVEEPNTSVLASAASVVSLGSACAAVKSPNAGKRIKGNRITILAEASCGTPDKIKKVLFQYKASSGTAWLDIPAANSNHLNPDTVSPYFTHWDVSGAVVGNYDLRAVATDSSDVVDPAPGSITVTVVASNSTEFDISESETVVSGKVVLKKEQALQNQTTNTIQVSDVTTGQSAKCVLPPQALSADSVVVTVIQNPTLPSAKEPTGTSSIGSSIDVTLSNGQSALSNGKKAVLTLSYPDTNSDGIVDNTKLDAKKLQMYSYNGASWSADVETTVDTASKTVIGRTSHFSFFAVFGAPTAIDINQIRVWPNPYKPNSGNTDAGIPYSASDQNSGVNFDNLPNGALLRIYDAAGELVAENLTGATTGRLQWDVKNSREQDVASGVYYAVISAPGYKSAVKRVMVIR